MSGFFDYDNSIWRAVGKFWDILILNLLWMVCSFPIVTVGASTTAMYYVTISLVRDEDCSTIKSFFRSFKENFKQATVIWLVFLAVIIVLGFDWYFTVMMMAAASTARTVMSVLTLALVFLWLAMFTYVFPLQARFYNPVKKTIANAFIMSIRHLFYTIGMLVIDGFLLVVTFRVIPLLMAFGVALEAYVNSFFIHKIFLKYMPKEGQAVSS